MRAVLRRQMMPIWLHQCSCGFYDMQARISQAQSQSVTSLKRSCNNCAFFGCCVGRQKHTTIELRAFRVQGHQNPTYKYCVRSLISQERQSTKLYRRRMGSNHCAEVCRQNSIVDLCMITIYSPSKLSSMNGHPMWLHAEHSQRG